MAICPDRNDPNYKSEMKRMKDDPFGYAEDQARSQVEEREIRAAFKIGDDVSVDDPRYIRARADYRQRGISALHASRESRAEVVHFSEPQGRDHGAQRVMRRMFSHYSIPHSTDTAQRVMPIVELLLDNAEGDESKIDLNRAGPLLKAAGVL